MNLEDQLQQTLHERTLRTDYPSTALVTVVGRARAVRRRRRRRKAVVTTAAVAVLAIPAAALWFQDAHRSTPEPATHTWRGMEEGTSPDTPYLRGSEYHWVNSVIRLPAGQVTAAAPYRRGWLISYQDAELDRRLTWSTDQMQPRWTRCGGAAPSIVQSFDGTRVAYTTTGCRDGVTTLHLGPVDALTGPELTERVPGHDEVRLVGITRDGVVYNVRSPGGNSGSYVNDLRGHVQRIRDVGPVTATDPSGHLVAGRLGAHGNGVVDQRSGQVLWRTPEACCAFSFDGSYALAIDPTVRSSSVSRELQVFDTHDGVPKATIRLPRGLYAEQATWDLDDTVLVCVTDADPHVSRPAGDPGPAVHQAILRFDLVGGAPTVSAPVIRLDGGAVGYAFGTPGT
jgi:hypothetical protein